MHLLFLLLRIYPYWALPCAFVVAEVGVFFRRKKSPVQFIAWLAVLTLIVSSVLWIVNRGDLNSDKWLRNFWVS